MALKRKILVIVLALVATCFVQAQSTSADSIAQAWKVANAKVSELENDVASLNEMHKRLDKVKHDIDSLKLFSNSQRSARNLLRGMRDERLAQVWLTDLLDTCYHEPYATEALNQLPLIKNKELKAEIEPQKALIEPYGKYAKELDKIVRSSRFFKQNDGDVVEKEYDKLSKSVSSSTYVKDLVVGKVDTIPYLSRVTSKLLSMSASQDTALSQYCKSLTIVLPPTLPMPCDTIVLKECNKLASLLEEQDVEMKKTREEIANANNTVNTLNVNIEESQRRLATKWELPEGGDVLKLLEAKLDSMRSDESYDEAKRNFKYMILSDFVDATLNNRYDKQSVKLAKEKIGELPEETQQFLKQSGYEKLIAYYGTYTDEIAQCLEKFKDRCDKRQAWDHSLNMAENELPRLDKNIKATAYYRNYYSADENIPFLNRFIDKVFAHVKSGKMTQDDYKSLTLELTGKKVRDVPELQFRNGGEEGQGGETPAEPEVIDNY